MAAPVGFIGLGNMGRPMAENLVKHGFSLVVHDVDPAKTDAASRARRRRGRLGRGGGRRRSPARS